MNFVEFSSLEEVVLSSITGLEKESDFALFTAEDGRQWRMWHRQDCCESVSIEDVIGDVDDLIGTPILVAEEVENPTDAPEAEDKCGGDDTFTWTFYKLRTIKGSVTVRWYGTSNGYHSESVSFEQL